MMLTYKKEARKHSRKMALKNKQRVLGTLLLALILCLLLCVILIFSEQRGNSYANTASDKKQQRGMTSSFPSESTKPSDSRSHGINNREINWYLTLVNPWNPLPNNYQPTLTQLKNNHAIDSRCYSELQSMMDDCHSAGLNPLICSSYRTMAKQQQLFEKQTNIWLAKGFSDADARKKAAASVAIPGTSEHQLGLAVDIVDIHSQLLDSSQEDTPVQQWLMKNSWKYGFILRYPTNKSDITGIIYEPWHYRYVGKKAAKIIYRENLCLEEYLDRYHKS